MSFAAIAGAIGTAAGAVGSGLGAAAGTIGTGLGAAGKLALATPGLLAKGVTATPELLAKGVGQLNPLTVADGAQKASMMNKFLMGAKNLGTEEIKRQLPKFGETLGTDKSKLGALMKDLIHKAPEAAMAQEKRNPELISRYSTTPTLTPAPPVRPAYSTNLQSILQDYRRS